jgi:hypothetical protein
MATISSTRVKPRARWARDDRALTSGSPC